nr:MAG TPA: hypothetical protein [Caudoviricetes sp.]
MRSRFLRAVKQSLFGGSLKNLYQWYSERRTRFSGVRLYYNSQNS